MVIDIPTSDSVVWNIENILVDISYAMSQQASIVINLKQEGPDLKETGLYDHLLYCASKFNYNLSKITILTCNILEQHNSIKIKYTPPIHFVHSTKKSLLNITAIKNTTLKHFGIFIGRSNAPRLMLSTYLNKYSEKTIQSFHYTSFNDYHRNHIGLEESIRSFSAYNVLNEAKFLSQCPIKLDNKKVHYPMLVDQHNDIHLYYKKFFVEIICETYYSGETFFPTEKTWRCIAMKTPFIIQGPAWYLHNLRKLGFKTFADFWDEGYSEDPPAHAVLEIIKVIDVIEKLSEHELKSMYIEMQPILEHNYNTLMDLTELDFYKIK